MGASYRAQALEAGASFESHLKVVLKFIKLNRIRRGREVSGRTFSNIDSDSSNTHTCTVSVKKLNYVLTCTVMEIIRDDVYY